MMNRRSGFLTGMIAGGMMGAITGMIGYKRMSPKHKRSIDRNLNKVIDQMTDAMETLHDMAPFDN